MSLASVHARFIGRGTPPNVYVAGLNIAIALGPRCKAAIRVKHVRGAKFIPVRVCEFDTV